MGERYGHDRASAKSVPHERFATIAWATLCVIVGAGWRPGWAGEVALLAVALMGANGLEHLTADWPAWPSRRRTSLPPL
jgi:hypothetical protein